ncbi:uncharacterized protein LOC141815434 [Curcuma longa]|uniref:uncharacterized protein LOC141815434 n=1 Tax=Curcuma longa TaxID=136217 RepID=UPI003D9EE685
MAKRSIKRPPQVETGCMWPIISLFDFRQSPPAPRLLSDSLPASFRQGGRDYPKTKLDKPGSNEDKGENVKKVAGTKAVKTLMKEEMFQERSNNYKLNSDSDFNNQTRPPSLAHQRFVDITLANGSSLDFGLVAFLVQFYADKGILVNGNNKTDLSLALKAMVQKMNDHSDHSSKFDSLMNQKDYILYKALADVFEVIENQKFVDVKLLLDYVSQSKTFMEALEILNSNKDVVLKLLKDPNSYVYRCQEAETGKFDSLGFESYSENIRMSRNDIMSSNKGDQVENEDMVNKQNRSRFFWRKDRSKEIGSPRKKEINQNQASVEKLRTTTKEQKIISAPNFSPASHSKTGDEEGDRVMSKFSLGEIKRKIRSIIGGSKKERRAISMDGILHKIPIGHKVPADGEKMLNNDSVVASSESKSLQVKEKPSMVSPNAEEKNNSKVNPEGCKPRISNDISATKSTPPIYEEAKKYFVDLVDTEGPRTSSRTAHVSKSLGKLFSMQEDDALRMKMSCKCEKEVVLTSEEAVSIPLQKFNEEDANNSLSPSKQNVEVLSCSIDYQNDEEILGLKTEIANKCVVSDPNHAGNVQNVETVDAFSKLLNDQSDALSESNSNEAAVAFAVSSEDLAHSMIQSVPSSYCKDSFKASESPTKKPGRSPVSTFEKFIPDDFTIPKLRAVHPIFPTKEERITSRTYFADGKARIKYIEAVLEASELRAIDFSRWHLANNLLEQSVYDEVRISCYPQIDDPKLIFDCIYEALKEIQEKFFKCTPWVSLLSSNVLLAPAGLSLSKEVDRIIRGHIPIDFSDSIDPIVTNDIEIECWMDLQFETEEVVLEIWDTALDDLVEEAIFDLWLDLSADW